MFVSSTLKGINDAVMGYLPRVPTGLFGPPLAGKTIFSLQEGLAVAAQMEKDVLYIGTEGEGYPFVKMWEDTFRKRFNIPKKINLVVKDLRTIEEILNYFGWNVEVVATQKGKVELVFKGEKKAEIEPLLKKTGVLIIDSMSNPLKIGFPGGRVNLPSRADAASLWLNSIHRFSVDYDLVTLVIHHESRDPTNQWALPSLTGGSAIRYNFKCLFYLEQRAFKAHKHVRDLFAVRWGNLPSWTRLCSMLLDSQGYHDISDEELREMARKSKTEEGDANSSGGA